MEVKIIKYNGIDHAVTKCRNSDEAKKIAKNSFDKTCIFSDVRDGVVGCHIYSAGIYPLLKCYPINVIALQPRLHCGKNGTLDVCDDGTERTAEDRINYIIDNCHPDWLGQVRNRLELLEMLAYSLGVLK